MRLIARMTTVAMCLTAALTLGCGDSNSEEPSGNCNTDVTSITSPAMGEATMHGSFFQNETVIIQETDGTEIGHGTPSSDRNAFTIGGVPSGTHTYEIIISCDSGRESLGNFTFTID